MKDKNRSNEDFEMLYDEALSLLNEEGEITTTLLQRKFDNAIARYLKIY